MQQSESNCGQDSIAPFSLRPQSISGTLLDLTRLSEGNDPPLDSEIPFIRGIISEELARVDALDAQINRDCEDAPPELIGDRAEAAERIRKHRSILSPVRRMPPELICGIFALLLEDDDEILPTPLWHLGHICRSWRLFVLGDTQFWRCITIPTAPLRPGDCAMVEAQLLRSGNAPLKVYWVVGNTKETMDPRMADLLVAESNRWVSLRLDVFHSHSVDALEWLRPVHGHLAALRKLEMDHGSHARVPDVFGIAPSLREVYLTDWALGHASPDISIPWGQVVRYRGSCEAKFQFEILQAAPNLQHCVVGFEDSLDHDECASVTLPQLRCLYIENPGCLVHLSTPILEDLFCLEAETPSLPSVLAFVRSSSCALTRLILMECAICGELITLLRGLPALTYLLVGAETDEEEQEKALFEAMTLSGTSDICPRLASLWYGVGEQFPQDPFFAMIHSRLMRRQPSADQPQPHSCLTRLRIFDTDDNIEVADIEAPIRVLHDEGLDVVFMDEYLVDLLKAEILV
ncbi:hypothetical protein DFH08DRAFT_868089 [Mycena albidolilacea]|uniref:F-box domain-containing protein n=1 Tax=Mycena albidolilacea TaxID=1033008 RepID=A0AAD7EQN2_9AGAR|nr:hypothetical protein DFH08DRAFT_868089 [Mycena albidolilacea]